MTPGQLFQAVSFAALAAGLALAGCRQEEKKEPPPAKGEMPVEQTPVSSIYEEKPGILYERPARTPTSATPTASAPPAFALTPSPSSFAPRASEDKPGRGKG